MPALTDFMEFVHPDDCACYECAGEDVRYEDGHRTVMNNMKHHTFGEPCSTCGKPKSEYKDLGTKGLFVCWYCTKRAGGPPV